MSSRMYSGTSDVTAHFNPWTQNAPVLMREGGFVGFQRGTGTPVFINPQGNVAEGLVKSGNIAIIGPKRIGKDTLCKCLATILGGMQAGVKADGTHIVPSTWVYDLKREAGRGEWTKVAKFYRKDSTVFAKDGRFNLTAHHDGVTADHHAQLINLVLRAQTGLQPTSYQLLGLQMVIDRFHEFEAPFDPSMVAHHMHRLTKADLKAYMDNGLDDFKERYAERMRTDEKFARFMAPVFMEAPSIVLHEDLFNRFRQEVVDYASALIGLTTIAEYGKIWTGTDSIYDLMGRRLCHWDLNGLNELASNSMELALEFAQRVLSGEGEGDSPLMPHYVFYDEQGSALTSEPHAALRAEMSRKKRATKGIEFSVYQEFDAPLKIGDAGSALREHGRTIYEGTDAFLISQIPDDDDIKDLIVRKGATDYEAYVMTKQEQGQWAFLAKGYAVEFFDHYVSSVQLPLIDTESAARLAAQRRDVTDTAVYQQRMRVLASLEAQGEPIV